jgi:predicted dehydrogenase
MPQSFRVGVVGAASSYSLHYAQALVKLPDVEYVGQAHLGRDPRYIADSLNLHWLSSYPKTVEGLKERYGGGLYREPEELIDEGGADALCICTEDYLHQHYALRAIDKGVHVFLPKPFAKSRAEAEASFCAANERDLVAVGSLPHRFRAPAVTARQAILDGAIGRPISGHFSISHHLTLGGWKSDPTMASGPEYEVGFYVFDLMRMMMLSDPATVVGYGANLDHRGIPYIDNGKCMVQCQNGALASIDLILSQHHRFPAARSFYVVGDEGALTLEKDPETGQDGVAIYTPDGVERREIPSWNPFERELGTWIDLCREGKDPSWWQEEGLLTLDLISAYVQAYQCCGVVDVTVQASPEACACCAE